MREFKAHVEGLRAFAVLPILLFHLEAAWCPGGFVGVDIFFVISGYLITGMILSQMQAGGEGFSFRTFYVRRFFRLFPALITVLAGTLIAGWYVLAPSDYRGLGLSAAAAVLAVSNLYFLATVDYFNASALAHPLLHTWSLAVEEQFYLVWPALLMLWLRWRLPLWALIAGTTVLSFAALLALQSAYPEAVFYLMPFRMFELSIGACLVLIEPWFQRLTPTVRHAAGGLGAALLAVSLVAIDGHTAWPSWSTLLPVLATALLILAGGTGIWGSVLGHALPRIIGRISYSVYLVHWPLITLYRTHAITEPSRLELIGLGVLSLVLGAALYAAVEVPFRLKSTHARDDQSRPNLETSSASSRSIARLYPAWARTTALALSTTAVLGAAAAIAHTGGFPSRLDRTRVQYTDNGLTFAGDLCSFKRARCAFGEPAATQVLHVVGDSYALNWVHGLDGLLREIGMKGIGLYDNGCLFAYGTKRFLNGVGDETCRRNVAEAYAYLAQNRQPVILAGDYAGYINAIGPADATSPLRHDEAAYYAYLGERMAASLEELDASNRVVILVKQTYSTEIDLAKCLAQPGIGERERATRCVPQTLERALAAAAAADRMIDALAAKFPSLVVLDPKRVFCQAERCTVEDARGLFFRDTAHLTNAGSTFLVAGVRERLLKALRKSD